MTKSAIGATLVGIKNVAIHKSVALTIHVPQERAMEVINMFGWPTMVDPIHVAVARLDPDKIMADASTREDEDGSMTQGTPELSNQNTSAATPKREMTLANKLAVLGHDIEFQSFLYKKYPELWSSLESDREDYEIAACIIRTVCEVESRRDIIPGSQAMIDLNAKILSPFEQSKLNA